MGIARNAENRRRSRWWRTAALIVLDTAAAGLIALVLTGMGRLSVPGWNVRLPWDLAGSGGTHGEEPAPGHGHSDEPDRRGVGGEPSPVPTPPAGVGVPRLQPVPRQVQPRSDGYPLPATAVLFRAMAGGNAGSGGDLDAVPETALAELTAVLREAGVRQVTDAAALDGSPLPHPGADGSQESGQDVPSGRSPASLRIWAGLWGSPAIGRVLDQLNVPGPGELEAEGYVVVAGQVRTDRQAGIPTLVLAGADARGLFYAVQTLRQLLVRQGGQTWIPGVQVVDEPALPVRGVIEGFYGPPWSHQARLRLMPFMAQHKLNTYVYAPKDDPFHRERWRDPYPASSLARLAELVKEGRRHQVRVVFAISPGKSVCHTRDADFDVLMQKAQQVWDIGIRDYAILWDDIEPVLHCPEDRRRFADAPSPLAAAQAHLLNRFQRQFLDARPGAGRLITVPTQYWQRGTTPYRRQLAEELDPRVIVYWTGIGVVPARITAADAAETRRIFQHDLLLWDNYPVNDFQRNRLFLGPLVGRDPQLPQAGLIGLTANPMNEAEASRIPLATVADFAWNPAAYDPEASWDQALRRFGGKVYGPLRVLASHSRSSRLETKESPELVSQIQAFWEAYRVGRLRAGTESQELPAAARPLMETFAAMAAAPAPLRRDLDNPSFLAETEPYLRKLELYGRAGQAAVRMLVAAAAGDTTTAARQRREVQALQRQLAAIPQQLAASSLDRFLSQALEEVSTGR